MGAGCDNAGANPRGGRSAEWFEVAGAPTKGKVKQGKPLGTVATGGCGDDDAGDYLSMLLFRRQSGEEADPEADPEGVPFAGAWAIAGCAYPDDKRTANMYRGELVPCVVAVPSG